MVIDFYNMTDNELYGLLSCEVQADRESAFKEIYSRYSRKVYFFCRRMTSSRHNADDLYQETFLKLLQTANRERVMTNLPSFILKIARNLFLQSVRDKKGEFVSLGDLEIGYVENHLENKELSDILVSSLELLPAEQREALVLQTYDNMSYIEIAEFMEVPVTTVRNWIVRSKKRLREIVTPYFENKLEN